MAEKVTGEAKVEKVAKERTFPVTFRGTRKFDLHIGRKMYTFKGKETKNLLKSEIDHPDFKQAIKYFSVGGIR